MTNEFTKRQQQEIKELINECANYYRAENICLLIDGACYMLMKLYNNGKVCKYFKNAVIPLNPVLEAAITHKKPTEMRKCEMCKKSFIPKANKQLYCSDNCKSSAQKIRNRERSRKQREKQRLCVTESFHYIVAALKCFSYMPLS